MAKTTTFDLEVTKHTDNKVVFAEKLNEEDVFAVRRVSGIYVDKRDLRDLGWTGKGMTLTITAA